ncbi:MAG TPA: Gfo/Idh/MocA family oxidoreductase [Prolixibacteraceae bacterium]|nr:Gfo/Idh/MocA family oxidoreductase [Prolixibacteraceae bacterium]
MNKTNRRKFIKQAGIAASALIAVPTIIPASCVGKSGQTPPSDRINLAFIGAGNQAGNDVRQFLTDERVQVTTICDVNKKSDGYWSGRVAGREYIMEVVDAYYTEKYGKSYQSAIGIEDFREVIADEKIDAVEIATPDHWHAIPVLMAAAAKKDIYCQKPLSLTIAEGRAMSDAVNHHGVVFQTGSQQRSNAHFRRICELVVNGRIGELKQVVCGLPSGTPDFGKKASLTEPAPVPKGFNYDMWLGQAPEVPYRPCASHVNFRWVLDYSGGQLTDWGGHHPDIAQWGMQTQYSGPVRIQNPRSKWSNHPVYNTATDFYFESIYENGVELIIKSDGDFGVTFIGTEGKVWSSRTEHKIEPESLTDTEIGTNEIHLYKSDNHFRNFIDCVKSREEPIAPVEVAHRSITIAHLGNISMMLDQDLEWDPETERITNIPEANKMLSRPMREPWGTVYKEHLVSV